MVALQEYIPLLGHAIISTNVLGLVLLPIPIALAFAILRYRLFDIDVIINRALVYGSLSAILALVYAVSVIALKTLVSTIGGQTTLWPPAIVASTLLIAALLPTLTEPHPGRDRSAFLSPQIRRGAYAGRLCCGAAWPDRA